MSLWRALLLAAGLAAMAVPGRPQSTSARFREAGDAVRAGDYPKGTALYRDLAARGAESASLYWNWAQAAGARGARGEALWALLRGLEIEPGDRALRREIERLRESANLDVAEISPEPLASLGRLSRRFHFDLVAVTLLALSLVLHIAARLRRRGRSSVAAWAAFVLGLCLCAVPVAAWFARPTGVVLRRDAPLLDSASPTAEAIGALREGEVVPVLGESGPYVRVEDSSGARGWASAEDVRRLDRAPSRVVVP
jgi:SH3 domain-containing protein